MTGRKISVTPEDCPRCENDPTGDSRLAHALTRLRHRCDEIMGFVSQEAVLAPASPINVLQTIWVSLAADAYGGVRLVRLHSLQ